MFLLLVVLFTPSIVIGAASGSRCSIALACSFMGGLYGWYLSLVDAA